MKPTLLAAPVIALGALLLTACGTDSTPVTENRAPVAVGADGTATVYFVETSGGA